MMTVFNKILGVLEWQRGFGEHNLIIQVLGVC
jgi:hypothetical protein